MDKIEVINILKKINLYENILDCLNVKFFYLESKKTENEFEENNNRLEKIKTSHQIEIQKGKLAFLHSEWALNFELLKENVRMNNLSNIILYNNAITDKNDKVKVYLNNDSAANSIYGDGENYEEISTLSLSKILDENMNEKICLKLDCEGAEYEIIELLSKNYLQKIEKTVIEYHMFDTQPHLLQKLQNTLENNFFELKTRSLFSDIGFLFALKK